VFRRRCRIEDFREVLSGFEQGGTVNVGDDVPSSEYLQVLTRFPALRAAVAPLAGSETPGTVASAVELVLEGLHLSRRLNKDAVAGRATYRARG
jgi:magnesium chelatase subunit I